MTAIVRSESWEVDRRLSELDLSRTALVDIVKAAVAGQDGCTENDPPNARGYESFRYGTRRARELLRGQGWEKDDTGNFSTVINHSKRIRLVVMNADGGAGVIGRVPQNRCRKGPNSERAANANQRVLFSPDEAPMPEADGKPPQIDGYATWHLCVYIGVDTVRAELSLLNDFQGGYFIGQFEKIIVIGDGDWKTADAFDEPDEGDDGPEFDIQVTRK